MNIATQTTPARPFDGFVGGRKPMDPGTNPHSPRYAYMPPVQNARSEARTTGYVHFNPGTLITFRTFESGGWPNPDFYQNAKARPLVREFSAEMAAHNAEIGYASVEGHDVGFTPLPMLTGVEDAQRYFDALHPSFAAIGHRCPYDLAECPTCRIEWFESDGSSSYFARYGEKLDADLALQVKTALYNANLRNRDFADSMWTEFADGYERTRNNPMPFKLDKTHHHYRRCLHLPDFKESIGAPVMQSVPIAAGHDLSDGELAEVYAKRAAANAGNADSPFTAIPRGLEVDYRDAETAQAAEPPQKESASEIAIAPGMIVMYGDSPVEVRELKNGGWAVVEFKDTGETKTVRKGELSL